MPRQTRREVTLHVRPFRGQDAVHHSVPDRAIAPGMVVTNHAVLAGAEGLDGPLRGEIEVVCPQTDDAAAQCFERVPKEQELHTVLT